MTWSERFANHLRARGISQQDAAQELKISPSKVHYWSHGATPRKDARALIAAWSNGEVPADVEPDAPDAAESGTSLPADRSSKVG